MTWSADTDLTSREVLAASALSAYSVAAVARGESAVTTYAVFRTMANAEILARFEGKGLTSGDLTNTAGLLICEAYLALSKLFESVEQWTSDERGDIYALKHVHWQTRYDAEIASVQPSTNRLPIGRSFSWDRG